MIEYFRGGEFGGDGSCEDWAGVDIGGLAWGAENVAELVDEADDEDGEMVIDGTGGEGNGDCNSDCDLKGEILILGVGGVGCEG